MTGRVQERVPVTVLDSAVTPVLLPEPWRVPNQAMARQIGEWDLRSLRERARRALGWGPDERNGCRRGARAGSVYWVDAANTFTCPDPWTPSLEAHDGFAWHVNGVLQSQQDQPAKLAQTAVIWCEQGMRHRAHAPAVLHVGGGASWWWRNTHPSPALSSLLSTAWDASRITGREVLDLLDRAERTDPGGEVPVTSTGWVAHVLLASPALHVDRETRTWLALLAA